MLSLVLQAGVRLICPEVEKGRSGSVSKLRLLPFCYSRGNFRKKLLFGKVDSHTVANVVTIIGK